jgi:hypothetical protein
LPEGAYSTTAFAYRGGIICELATISDWANFHFDSTVTYVEASRFAFRRFSLKPSNQTFAVQTIQNFPNVRASGLLATAIVLDAGSDALLRALDGAGDRVRGHLDAAT